MKPGLILVATPIGNLGDISARALETLRGADVVVCEDTRVTGKLLRAFGIDVPLLPYNDHNAARQRPKLLSALSGGKSVALVSDAGMPLISDPGYKLVSACVETGIGVTSVPGASAPLMALQLSGLPSDAFAFAGFLPAKSAARRKALAVWAGVPATLLFFETGPRLAGSLADMLAVFGDRPAAVARELTKMFEEVRRGTLGELASFYEVDGPPKGEIVVVVGAPVETPGGAVDLDALLRDALERMSVRDAAAFVAEQAGAPKKTVYARALELAGKGSENGTE